MSSQPLDFIEIVEMHDGSDPVVHTIKLIDITKEGLVIGRDANRCDIPIGDKLKDAPIFNMISRQHCVLYKHDSDYYLRRGYRDGNSEWITPEEGSGLDIFVAGRPTERGKAIQLRCGALVNIVPKLGGYQCQLHWAAKTSESQPPTMPVDEDNLKKIEDNLKKIKELSFQKRILQEQSEVREVQLKELQQVNARITKFATESERVTDELRAGLEIERQTNKRQDKKLAKLKMFGALFIGLVAIALGVEIEEIERIAEVGALLAGGGMFLTASSKD